MPRALVLTDDRFYAFSTVGPGVARGTHRFEGQPHGNLARFMPDGALDPAFVLDAQLGGYTITAAAVTAHDKLVVACIADDPFEAPTRVVRLNADGSIDPSFDAGVGAMPPAGARALVQAIEVEADGKLIVVGQFGDFSNSGHRSVVRLNPDGSVDSGFAAVQLGGSTALGVLSAMATALQPDGKVLVAGAFDSVNGVSRPCVVRLHPDGTLDTSFVPQGFIPSSSTSRMYPSRPISSVVLQPSDGRVVLGGVFNPEDAGSNGPSTQMLVRLNADGTLDNSFTAHRDHPSRTCRSLVRLADGRLLVAFDRGIARYETGGAYDTAFNSNFPSVAPYRVMAVALQSTGQAIVGGTFSQLFGRSTLRANTDGTLDAAFQLGQFQRERLPERVAVRSDGRSVVGGGFFDRVNNTPRAGVAILERNGSLAQLNYPHTLAYPNFLLGADDKVLFFGRAMDGDRFTCERFNRDTTRDTSFTADPATMEFQQAMQQPDGSYLLSSGESAQAVANEVLLTRMRPDGSIDSSFDLGIEENLLVERYGPPWPIIYRMHFGDNRALAVLPNARILYHYFDRDSLHKIVLLEPNGAIDASFQVGTATPRGTIMTFPQIYDPKTGATVQPAEGVIEPTGAGPSVALLEPDGRIILAGQFTSYNGVPAGGIVRLNSDGSLESTLGSGAAFTTTPITEYREPSVTEVQRDFAGRLLVVGDFDTFHGVPAPGIARLKADGSLDTTFVPPVTRRTTGYAFNDRSVLMREGAGRFLLVGNYSKTAGDSTATSIFRLQIPLRATSMVRTSQNALTISFTGVPGAHYTIQSSAGLTDGSFTDASAPIQAATDGSFVYEDASAFSSLQRFYRAVSLR